MQVADDDGRLDWRKDTRDKESRADNKQPPLANASASRVQARPEREGEQKRACPQKAEGKRHQEPVVAKLVFADPMARVEFRFKNVEHCKEYEECDRQSKRRAPVREIVPLFIVSDYNTALIG